MYNLLGGFQYCHILVLMLQILSDIRSPMREATRSRMNIPRSLEDFDVSGTMSYPRVPVLKRVPKHLGT